MQESSIRGSDAKFEQMQSNEEMKAIIRMREIDPFNNEVDGGAKLIFDISLQ